MFHTILTYGINVATGLAIGVTNHFIHKIYNLSNEYASGICLVTSTQLVINTLQKKSLLNTTPNMLMISGGYMLGYLVAKSISNYKNNNKNDNYYKNKYVTYDYDSNKKLYLLTEEELSDNNAITIHLCALVCLGMFYCPILLYQCCNAKYVKQLLIKNNECLKSSIVNNNKNITDVLTAIN